MRVRRLAVALPLLVISGCSGAGEPAPTPSGTATPTLTPMPSATDLAEAPPVLQGTVAATDVTLGECPTAEGPQTAIVTLVSSAAEPSDYVVTVTWVSDDYQTRGKGVTTLQDVEPGSSQQVEVTAAVSVGATKCSVIAIRGVVETP